MNISSKIWMLEDVLSATECADYIAVSEIIGYEPSPIMTREGFGHCPEVRNNARIVLYDAATCRDLWARIVDKLPSSIEQLIPIGLNERLRFYRYGPGEHFAPHQDGYFWRDNGERSLLTFMIYLNDNFLGGETRFGELTVVPKRGSALIFDHLLLHEGAVVTSGRKYVLRSDVMFSP